MLLTDRLTERGSIGTKHLDSSLQSQPHNQLVLLTSIPSPLQLHFFICHHACLPVLFQLDCKNVSDLSLHPTVLTPLVFLIPFHWSAAWR